MENFPNSASYEWTISAVNAAGQELCKAGPYKFVMSPDLAATPSFVISNVALPTAESGNDSSEASSGKHKNGPGEGRGSPGDTSLDESIIILTDSDSDDCRLFVIYKVKINHPFTSFQLIYGFSPGTVDGAVDLTANSSEPYPAYNQYSAVTPPLPVKNGDTVYFGISYTLDTGASASGLTLLHPMAHCRQ